MSLRRSGAENPWAMTVFAAALLLMAGGAVPSTCHPAAARS
jgi:hypothetical protein